MPIATTVLVGAAIAMLASLLAVRRRSRYRVAAVAASAVLLGGAAWVLIFPPNRPDNSPVSPGADAADATPEACAACHRAQYDSWHRTYHRTMTREATPENVKGNFANATYDYRGVRTRMTREGDRFFMETVDPASALQRAKLGGEGERVPPPRMGKFSVDRLVGSHWLQECLHRDPNGLYTRLPVLFHIGEQKWVHTHGAFLAPDADDFWSLCRGANWNESCLYCHNTGPAKNPVRDRRGAVVGYDTSVSELGISCEACHGDGGEHARKHRAGQPVAAGEGVAHPGSLSVPRRDDICARCHGALVPIAAAWDSRTHRDPFRPGEELTKFNHFFWSEAQQVSLATGRPADARPAPPDPTDGRFWGDGTPLTTALEFNGMALSACYQQGRGAMSCLSCHTMHEGEPTYLLKPKMQTNEACYQCHEGYRAALGTHTRHAADSSGSLCANCHMPHVVYSLMDTHRSHRIQVPDLAGSLGTGKPHACNLCHLDKSLGWTRNELARWPNGKKHSRGVLSPDEEAVAYSILALAQGDARTRVLVAGAFEKPAARQASTTDWTGPALTRLLQVERYPAVRYLAHRGLKATYGESRVPFDYLAALADRADQLRRLQQQFDANPLPRKRPFLPLTPAGLIDDAVLKRLLGARKDPDLTINE